LHKAVDNYEKQSGNKLELSIIPFAPMRQKTISAITSGEVPDLIEFSAVQIAAQLAWKDQLEDVSDVVETQKSKYHENAILGANLYNHTTRQRSFYGVPHNAAVIPFHVWGDSLRRPATRPPISRTPARRSSTSSDRFKTSCAPKGCATSLGWGSRSARSAMTRPTPSTSG
jgi:hypothetical protein